MSRRRTDAVSAPGIDGRHRIAGPTVPREERSAGYFLGQMLRHLLFKSVGPDSPAKVPWHGNMFGEHPQAHECARPHGSVIGAAHRVTLARVETPEGDVRRDGHGGLQLGRLTQERE